MPTNSGIQGWIETLESFGHRGSATENEQRAAAYLAQQLDQFGLKSTIEPFSSFNAYGTRIVVHLGFAALGLALTGWLPVLSALTAIIVLISLLAESSTRYRILSRLLPGSPSRNVTAVIPCPNGPLKKRIVLCAHFDTQRTGWIWSPWVLKLFYLLQSRLPGPLKSPLFTVDLALAAHIVLAGAFSLGIPVPLYAWGILAYVYSVTLVLAAQWATGEYVPGACDNASGVAAVLTLVGRWIEAPPKGVELHILLAGSEETGCLGSSTWLDRHGARLRDVPTMFLNLDTFGYGRPRFAGSECSLAGITMHYPQALRQLCEESARTLGLIDAGPFPIPTQTDGLSFLSRGFPGVTVMAFEDDFKIPNYHCPTDLLKNMDLDVTSSATHFSWTILTAMCE